MNVGRHVRLGWLGALARRPASSLPEAMGSVAATEAANRCFGNENYDFDDLLLEHQERTSLASMSATPAARITVLATCPIQAEIVREFLIRPRLATCLLIERRSRGSYKHDEVDSGSCQGVAGRREPQAPLARASGQQRCPDGYRGRWPHQVGPDR